MSRLFLLGMGLIAVSLAFSGSSCAPNQNDFPVEVGSYKGDLVGADGGVVGSIEIDATSPTTLGAVTIVFVSADASAPPATFAMEEALEVGGLADRTFASTAVMGDAAVTFSGSFYIKGVGDEYTVATGSRGTVTDASGQYSFTADLDTTATDGEPDN